jgi:glyceraldehyde 3-phosphate dehydrogenase
VADGALADLTVELNETATIGQVNRAFAEAAATDLGRVLRYTEQPLVSRDVIGEPASCVLDCGLTRSRDNLVKVFGWHDNERGNANRIVDLVELMANWL